MLLYLVNRTALLTFAVSIFLLVLMGEWATSNYFTQNLMLGASVLFTIYWAISVFVFLFNSSLYSSYTTVIQRYWNSALYIFWGLELYLFGTYIYLVIVAPTEVEWLLDQPQLFNSDYLVGFGFFNNVLFILLTIVSLISLQYILISLNYLAAVVGSFAVLTLLTLILIADFTQSYNLSIYFGGYYWAFDIDSSVWLFETSVEKTRTITQYVFLLTVLNFWHTVFIITFWLVTVMFNIQSPYIGQGVLAANKQNIFFLFGFAFLWSVLSLKCYGSVLSESVYFWFFVNSQSGSHLTSSLTLSPIWALL